MHSFGMHKRSRRRTASIGIASVLCLGAAGTAVGTLAPSWASSTPAAATAAQRDSAAVRDASAVRDGNGDYRLTWRQSAAADEVSVYASTDPDGPQRGGGTAVARGRTGTATVRGLDPTRRWYFTLVPSSSSGSAADVETATRTVDVSGADNVRDTGGYLTADGKQQVRWGQVFRSAALSGTTAAGDTVLSRLGVNQAIDFRSPAERKQNGTDRLPADVRSVLLPIDTGNASLSGLTPAKFKAEFGDGKAEGYMLSTYRQFVTSSADRAQFAAALRDIAHDSASGTLYHCTSGKDRTGWMTAVLLSVLGVPQHTVDADYLLSNRELAASNTATIAKLDQAGYDGALLTPMLTVSPAYLDTAMQQVKQHYGSLQGYVRHGLGLSAAEENALRARLLTPVGGAVG